MSEKEKLYPFVFEPIYKDRIWGGSKLKDFLDKDIPSQTTGESWEIADFPDDNSIVTNGEFAGESIKKILNQFGTQILGTKTVENFGNCFPLLFKFLDAKEDLSIQLHPNDELAKKRHNSFGKTEMWYIMQADKDAEIIVGFDKDSSAKEYLTHLENKTLPSILKRIKVSPGEVYYLETGTIHAIGKGIVIAEIQQTSDITYRVYDWDRIDASGKSRELHVDLALDAINYQKVDAQLFYTKHENNANVIVKGDYFTTNFIPLHGTLQITKDTACFRVYIVTKGNVDITIQDKTYAFILGQTILIPACFTTYELTGQAELLEIYIEY